MAFWSLLETLGYEITNLRQGSKDFLLEELRSIGEDEAPASTPKGFQNVRTVRKRADKQFLIAAYGSSGENGWWKVTATLLGALKAQEKQWVIVLLHGHASAGNWLEPADVERLIGSRWTKDSQDGYCINGQQDVPNCRRFVSDEELVICLDDFAMRKGLRHSP